MAAEQLVPPTANLQEPEYIYGFTLIPGGAPLKTPDLRFALSNSFGFGGVNVSLVFARHEA